MAKLDPAVRETILGLLRNNVPTSEIVRQTGESSGRIAAIRANLTRGTYDQIEDTEVLEEIEEGAEAKFGLERDLQKYLRKCIEQLEPGLVIIDGDKEKSVNSGRIDITAKDQSGKMVVIELKAGIADRDAIAQTLHYMGDLMDRDGGDQVRGIVVAGEFTSRAVAAARPVPLIRLITYGLAFNFRIICGQKSG